MPNRRRSLQPRVETSSGIDRSMTQDAADDLLSAGIGVEKQLGGDMSEQVGMHMQSRVGVDGSRDLSAEEGLVLWAAGNSRE